MSDAVQCQIAKWRLRENVALSVLGQEKSIYTTLGHEEPTEK
jgi:hypothetical protein